MLTMLKALAPAASRSGRPAPTRRGRKFSLKPRAEGLERREVMAALGLDPTFGLGGLAFASNPADTATTSSSTSLSSVAVQADGKVVAVGSRYTSRSTAPGDDYSSSQDIVVERRNVDGSPDASFGAGGVALIPLVSGADALDGRGVAVTVQPDGKILVLGSANTRDSSIGSTSINDFVVARLTPGGGLDTSFGGVGYRVIDFTPAGTTGDTYDSPASLALAPGGKIVVAGSTYTPGALVSGTFVDGSQDMAVARLNADGSLDGTFGGDGKEVVAFDLGGGKGESVASVLVGGDGKVVLVGTADVADVIVGTDPESSSDIAVARLNADGTPDGTFGGGGKMTVAFDLGGSRRDTAGAAVLDGDRVVIAGTATVSTNATASIYGDRTITNYAVVRLNANGSLDASFAGSGKYAPSLSRGGSAFSAGGSGLALLADGAVLVGGNASQVSSYESAAFFAKVLPAGNPDASYGSGGVAMLANTYLSGDIAIGKDGKVVFASGGGIARTTAPTPQVVSAEFVVNAAKKGKNAKKNSLTVKFNTALNPALAGKKTSYQVRRGLKGKRFLEIKRVTYNADTYETTILLKKPAPKGVVQVVLASAGIANLDSQLLNNGQDLAVTVTSTATTQAKAKG